MLFITNRVLDQSHRTRIGRSVTFSTSDNSALPSLFFCERQEAGEYLEIGSEPFFQRLRQSDCSQVLFYIHGFNELPEDAIFQKAERLQERLSSELVEVVPLIWPCKGRDSTIVDRYYTDQMAADDSGTAFARALAKFQAWQVEQDRGDDPPCAKRLNVVAHSMGARVLRRAVFRWSHDLLRHEPPLLFRNLFLAAADVVNETLEAGHSGHLLTVASRNLVVYHAADDLALRASKVANARQVSRRLGHTGPETISRLPANVYAKDCDEFNMAYDPGVGHTYFLEAPNGQPGLVLSDMRAAMETGRVPGWELPDRRQVLG